MPEYRSFNEEAISNALEAASRTYGGIDFRDINTIPLASPSRLSIRAECLSVTVENNEICLELEGVGETCIPLPLSVPNGTVAQACLDIEYWPPGVCVTVEVGGIKILEACFP